MSNKKTMIIGTALALGLSAGAMAAQPSFQADQLASGYGNGHDKVEKIGDHKCGAKMKDASCGADHKSDTAKDKMKDHSCGADHMADMKKNKMKDGSCGANHAADMAKEKSEAKGKMKEGKCGEHTCGAKHK